MYEIRVKSENLGPGNLPIIELEEGWDFPILSVSDSGQEIVQLVPNGRRVCLPTFEIAYPQREMCLRKLLRLVKAMCLHTGGSGVAYIMIRADYKVKSSGDWLHAIEMAIMFTADRDPTEPDSRYLDFPTRIWVEENGRTLDNAAILDVMES